MLTTNKIRQVQERILDDIEEYGIEDCIKDDLFTIINDRFSELYWEKYDERANLPKEA